MKVDITPQLDDYHLIDELESDNFGRLYLAEYEQDKLALIRTIAPDISSSENFLVRFELLRRLLPAIDHPNLVKALALGCTQNIYYLAKALPAADAHTLQTLAAFDLRDTPSQAIALEQLLLGIAEGLAALEEVRDSFHRNGIIHDSLSSDRIYLTTQKALLGGGVRLIPRIDHYCERFLYYGDNELAADRHRLQSGPLGKGEELLPPAARREKNPEPWWHQYSFAALAYQIITQRMPKGRLPLLTAAAPSHAPAWEAIIERCFASSYGRGYSSMREVVEQIQALASKEEKLPPAVRRIRREAPPEGMSLIALEEKATLGNHKGPPEERPLFKARLHPFYIDKTAVTNAQFEQFMPNRVRSSYSRADSSPATLVPWRLAVAYCDWRSKQESLPSGTYRLPTEYEWEVAARGATGEQYPWGHTPDPRYCHCGLEKESGAIDVTARAPSRFGIYQLLGNVWEWTCSSFQPHPLSKDRTASYNEKLKVAKGGCWMTPEKECRASARVAFPPEDSRANIGFRCVRAIES
jgi:formylglycine-generating enzyme required for sulfatase activity